MPDFTLEEVVGYGQQQGADPATIAKAVRAWHGSTVQEARDVIPDQEKFWNGTTKVDRTVADTLNSLRNAAQLQTAAKLFPDPQEFQQFSSVLESSGYDPMKMDAPPAWIEAAKKLDAAAADPVFAPPRHQYGKIAFGPNKLADYSIRTKEDGVGYEAMVYPSDDEGKPRGAPIRVELPPRDVMAQQMEEDVARKQAEFEQVSHGASSQFLSPEVSSMRARLPAIDAAYQNAQQSRDAIAKGTESTALHIGLNNALLNNDAFKATVPQNTLEQFTARPILGVVRSLAEGGSAATGTGKEDILTTQGHDAMDVLTPGRLRSRWEAQGNAMMAPGDAIESGMESLVSVMLPGGMAKLAGKALPALNAASVAGKAAYGTLGATSYGSNYAGALMEAEAVRPTDPAKADRILRYAQLTSALKAGIEMATERIFPDEAAVAGMKGMTWKQARKMPLHEGAEEFAGAVGQNLVNTIDGQQNQNPLENAWQGALGSLPFIGMGRVQHMISNRNAAGPAPAVAPASTLGGVAAGATLPIPPTAGSGSSPDVAAPYVQPPNASTADGNLPTGPGTVSDTLLTPATEQDPTGTVPELPATLDEQFRRVKSGTKPGMIFPGIQPEDMPAQYRPSEHDDLVATATPAGTVLHPLDIPRADVLAAVEQNKLGQLLGYGTDSKPTPTEGAPPPVAVTLRTADGTEVDSVAADPADAPTIAAHLQSRAEPGDTVQVETPEDVLKGRLPQDPSAAETDLFGDPLPSELTPETHPVMEVPLNTLSLSKDVPQFKGDADPKTGVVEPLGGKFERLGTGPILVWERRNGDLEIISGRHRADLARRSGEATIPGQIVREADGFTRDMALTADAELNIRDEKGSIKDFAAYFRHSGIDRLAAEERGLLARAPGRSGWAIGRDGSDSLFTLHANQKISDAAAAAIATAAPGNEALQAVGMKAVLEQRMSGDMAANLMAAASLAQRERAAAGEQGDLFGFDDSAVVEMTRQARRANAMQQAIREQITAVKGAARRPETARKLGVDVTDPEGLNRKIAQLTNDLARWENWSQQPDLVDMVRGTGENTLKEDTPDFFTGTTQDPFNLVSETPKERAAREAKELKAAQAKHAAEVARIKAEGEAMQGTLFEPAPAAIDIPSLVHYFEGNGADYRNNPASAELVGTLHTVANNPAGFSEEYEQGELFGGGGNLPGKSPGAGRRVSTKASPAAVQYAEGLRFTSWQNGQPVDWKTNPRVTSIMAAMVDGTIPAWNINGAVISTPEDFVNLVLPLRSPLFESVKIAVLNDKGKVMHSQVLTVGTVGETVLMSRDVLRVLETARRMKGQGKADGVIISHNHPSGNPDPSSADRMVTRTVEASLKAVGSRLIDHIVTNGESFYSFKAQSVQNLSSPQLAPWETVTASSRRQAFGGSDIKDIVTHLRQGDGNQHGHIIYMNQRLQVVAVERVDHTTAEPLTRQMMQVASELGANHLSVDLPHVPATKAMAMVRHLKNEMPLGFRLVDASDSAHPSYNEAGLMEPGPASLAGPNTLREDGPNDLHPGPTPATPEYDTRRFGLRVQADERLRDAWRARFTPTLYKTFTEETLRKQIREWIADNGGLEGAASLFLDATSGLQDFERNALGQQLALSYDLRARRLETAGNVDGMRQAEAALDQIIGTLETLATQAGQALRAFGMWSKLSPRGITRTVQREAGRRTDAKITENLGAEPADILGAVNAIDPSSIDQESEILMLWNAMMAAGATPKGKAIAEVLKSLMPRRADYQKQIDALSVQAGFRQQMTETGSRSLARNFWSLMAGPKPGQGALSLFDAATQQSLASLLTRAVQRAGLDSQHTATNQPTDVDKLVASLSIDPLRWDKINAANAAVEAEIEAMPETVQVIRQVNGEEVAVDVSREQIREAWEQATQEMAQNLAGPGMLRRLIRKDLSKHPVTWGNLFDKGKPLPQTVAAVRKQTVDRILATVQGRVGPDFNLIGLRGELETSFDEISKERYADWLVKRQEIAAQAKRNEARKAMMAALRPQMRTQEATDKLDALFATYVVGGVPGKPAPKPALTTLLQKHLKAAVPDFLDKMKALGVPNNVAAEYDAAVQWHRQRADDAALKAKQDQLIASLKPKDRKTREKLPRFIRAILEARRNGALSRADFHDAFAQAFGMPRFTPEFAAEIRALAAQVEATPAGSWLRQKAQSALMTRLAQWEGIPAGEIWTAFWYANILSGIGTQAVNISGNASHLLLKTVTTALSNNPVHTVQFFRGMLSGFTQGLPQAKAAFLHGDPVLKGEEMWQKKDVLEMLWSDNPTTLGRKIAKYGAASWGRYVFRALTAADAVFYNTAKEARAFLELSRTGQAQADPATVLAAQEQAKQDLQTAGATNTPANLDRRTLEILEAQRPAEVLAAARHFGGQATFNYDPEGTMGAFQKGINLISKAVPPVRAAIPFTRIVANLADQGLDWTGYGMVRGALGRHTFNSQGKKFSGRERIERALAGAIGMATYASLYALAKAHAGDDDDRAQFMIYGGGPTDKNRREQMPRGWKPYSIKIGDHYYSYAETPLSLMLGALGASMDKQRYGIKKPGDDDTIKRAELLLAGAGQSFSRTGIMSGLNSLFNQMDGTGSPKNFAARTASGFIPAQGLLRDIAKLMDDSKVSTATIEGVVLQNLPYLRSKAGKAYNVFGDIVREPGPWILSRLVTKQDPADKDATWLTRNNLHIPDLDQELVIGKYLSKEEIYAAKHRAPLAGERAQLIANLKNGYLTEDQRVQFLKTSGPLIRQSLQLLQRGPQLDPKTMQSRVSTATKAAREIAMRKLIGL